MSATAYQAMMDTISDSVKSHANRPISDIGTTCDKHFHKQ
jgi:hypothetical protein